jgi:hypothetical protein
MAVEGNLFARTRVNGLHDKCSGVNSFISLTSCSLTGKETVTEASDMSVIQAISRFLSRARELHQTYDERFRNSTHIFTRVQSP